MSDTACEASPCKLLDLTWPVLLKDRKSTRLNSSHRCNSYAVFCLKKKNSRDYTLRGGVGDTEHIHGSVGRHVHVVECCVFRLRIRTVNNYGVDAGDVIIRSAGRER